MTDANHIINILKQLSPQEVLEVCQLDDDAELVVSALGDFIEENFEEIQEKLEENGLYDEEED